MLLPRAGGRDPVGVDRVPVLAVSPVFEQEVERNAHLYRRLQGRALQEGLERVHGRVALSRVGLDQVREPVGGRERLGGAHRHDVRVRAAVGPDRVEDVLVDHRLRVYHQYRCLLGFVHAISSFLYISVCV